MEDLGLWKSNRWFLGTTYAEVFTMRIRSREEKQKNILLKLQEVIRLHALILESQKRIEKLLMQLPLESLNENFIRLQGGKKYKSRDIKMLEKCQRCTISVAGEWSFRRSQENPNLCTDCI